MTTGVRASSTVETPPQPTGDFRQWAEEIIDYLLRLNTDKQRQIDALKAYFNTDGSLNVWGIEQNNLAGLAYWYEIDEKVIFTGETTWGATNNMTIRYSTADTRGEWFMPNTSADDMLIGGQTADYTFGQHVAGSIEIKAMSAGAAATGTSIHGGDMTVSAGDADNNGDGGDLTLSAGAGDGSGSNGNIILANYPTSSAGLPTGAVWSDSGTLKVA